VLPLKPEENDVRCACPGAGWLRHMNRGRLQLSGLTFSPRSFRVLGSFWRQHEHHVEAVDPSLLRFLLSGLDPEVSE